MFIFLFWRDQNLISDHQSRLLTGNTKSRGAQKQAIHKIGKPTTQGDTKSNGNKIQILQILELATNKNYAPINITIDGHKITNFGIWNEKQSP